MQVRYQDIRINREYIIRGRGPYYHHPRMVVKVLENPPPFIPAGNFYPSFNVQVLQVIDIPFPEPDPTNQVTYTVGQVFSVNWRSNYWGQPWNDWGPCWGFRNSVLQPLPSDQQNKLLALSELKSIPPNPQLKVGAPTIPAFPGGTDFLALAATHQLRNSSTIVRANLEGGKTHYLPLY